MTPIFNLLKGDYESLGGPRPCNQVVLGVQLLLTDLPFLREHKAP